MTLAKTEMMRRIRGQNTRPELTVRRLLHGLGYRFRLHRRDLPGTPDIVFPARRAVILVHGCFWHQHWCRLGRVPKGNQAYWIPKLARNVEHDKKVRRGLRKLGWRTLIVWECEVARYTLASRLQRFLAPVGEPSGLAPNEGGRLTRPSMSHNIRHMSRGPSRRLVVELEPGLKERLYATLALDSLTFKDWLTNQAERYISDRGQAELFAAEPTPKPYIKPRERKRHK